LGGVQLRTAPAIEKCRIGAIPTLDDAVYHFYGQIDEVAFFNRALSWGELSYFYHHVFMGKNNNQ
jgi:hypothetical protein